MPAEHPFAVLKRLLLNESFALILAIKVTSKFITTNDAGDLLSMLLLLCVVVLGVALLNTALYEFIYTVTPNDWNKHARFLGATFTFGNMILMWLLMILYSTMTQWISVAFYSSDSISNFVIFSVLIYFAFIIGMVPTGVIGVDKKDVQQQVT